MKFCPECGSKIALKEIDGAKRFVCEGCNYIHWNNPAPVVAALVHYEGKYIIARNTLWPRGIFSVITGYLEQNETPEQAVLREVEEELGLSGRIKRFIGNYTFFEKNQVILCYEVEAEGEISTNHELAEVKVLLPDELKAYDFSPLYITEQIVRDWEGFQS